MRSAMLFLLAFGLVLATAADAANPVRISQIYGGGGGYYKCDFVELFNNSDAAVDIGGWSVQYAASSATVFGSATYNWAKVPSGATIPPCGYYLIRGYCSSAGADLPVTPDIAPSPGWTFNLSATAGKVALFGDQVTGRTCPQAQAAAVDLVGYGPANCFETAVAPALDMTSVLVRAADGAADTDDNAADFRLLAQPWPLRNSASPTNPSCGRSAAPPEVPALLGPLDGATGVEMPATLAVAVSDPDADSLIVRFYGRPVPVPQPGACCLPDGGCAFVAPAECATLAGTFLGAGVPCESGFCEPPGEPFTLALIPDTQEYTTIDKGGLPAMFEAQTQWCVDNRVRYNIVAVAHEGDITDKDDAIEYDRAEVAMRKLENPLTTGLPDGIPYAMLRGNHDASSELFNRYYGVSRFAGRSYYGGHYGTTNDNSYILFSNRGRDFVLIALSYAPSSDVLTWARGVLAAHPDRRGIVVSHSILDESPGTAPWTSHGQAIYDALRGAPNLVLMLCGHMASPSTSPSWHGEGRRTDVDGGYTVHSLLADYQDRENGGHGLMRLLHFVPAENRVLVRTYSPYTDEWEADADSSSQFTLAVELGGGPPPPPAGAAAPEQAPADFPLVGSVAGAPSGTAAGVVWEGLEPLTQYEWYATVSDRYTPPVAGPVWGFITLDTATPALLRQFTATAVASGVELRWEFSDPAGLGGIAVERAPTAEGPWAPVAVERREEAGVSVAVDRDVPVGSTHWYRLIATLDGTRVMFGPVVATAAGESVELALGRPLPNPATGAARVDFALPQAADVSLRVYDMLGRQVATLVDGPLPAGRHQVTWDGAAGGRAVPAGLYSIRLVTPQGTRTERLIWLRR